MEALHRAHGSGRGLTLEVAAESVSVYWKAIRTLHCLCPFVVCSCELDWAKIVLKKWFDKKVRVCLCVHSLQKSNNNSKAVVVVAVWVARECSSVQSQVGQHTSRDDHFFVFEVHFGGDSVKCSSSHFTHTFCRRDWKVFKFTFSDSGARLPWVNIDCFVLFIQCSLLFLIIRISVVMKFNSCLDFRCVIFLPYAESLN